MRKIGYDSWIALAIVAVVLMALLFSVAVTESVVDFLSRLWSEEPSSETAWNIVGMLLSAAIAAGAAILAARWSAKSTMANARELQDCERRKDEESCAAILAADLHMKLTTIVTCLEEPPEKQVTNLAEVLDPSTKVLDAVMPKLGDLGPDGAANLLSAYLGVEFVVGDSKQLLKKQGPAAFKVPQPDYVAKENAVLLKRTRHVACDLGAVVDTLSRKYGLARPHRYEEMNLDLEALGLKELKDRGL